MRQELAEDPRMKVCVHCGSTYRVQWQHCLIYQGRQINELYAIQPLCERCHMGEGLGSINQKAKMKAELEAISTGINSLIVKYPKFDWRQRLRYLQTQDTTYGPT